LLQDRLDRGILKSRRIAVFAEDAFYQNAHAGTRSINASKTKPWNAMDCSVLRMRQGRALTQKL
jgi:hypothetical protein